MSYITLADTEVDTNLHDLVTQNDLDESDQFFNDLANSLGVYTTEIETSPFPIQCKRVIRFWVYCEVCKRNIGSNVNRTQDGYETDWYEAKLKQYTKDLAEAVQILTGDIIRGIATDYIHHTQQRNNTIERA